MAKRSPRTAICKCCRNPYEVPQEQDNFPDFCSQCVQDHTAEELKVMRHEQD